MYDSFPAGTSLQHCITPLLLAQLTTLPTSFAAGTSTKKLHNDSQAVNSLHPDLPPWLPTVVETTCFPATSKFARSVLCCVGVDTDIQQVCSVRCCVCCGTDIPQVCSVLCCVRDSCAARKKHRRGAACSPSTTWLSPAATSLAQSPAAGRPPHLPQQGHGQGRDRQTGSHQSHHQQQ